MEHKMTIRCIDMISSGGEEDDQMNMMIDDLRRGPWTVEEDFALMNYIAHHGEGRWNSLARCAGMYCTLCFTSLSVSIHYHNTIVYILCI